MPADLKAPAMTVVDSGAVPLTDYWPGRPAPPSPASDPREKISLEERGQARAVLAASAGEWRAQRGRPPGPDARSSRGWRP